MSYCNTLWAPPLECGPNGYGQTQLAEPASMYAAVDLINIADSNGYHKCADAIYTSLRNPLDTYNNCQRIANSCSQISVISQQAQIAFQTMHPDSYLHLGN